jgi:hypothetical protein
MKMFFFYIEFPNIIIKNENVFFNIEFPNIIIDILKVDVI